MQAPLKVELLLNAFVSVSVPGDDYPTGSISGMIILYIAIPIVFVVMCTCLVLIIRKKQKATRPPVTYQTTSGAINLQAGETLSLC
jgi:TRAP-type C4-dicarboxylate transport system permease small subunit